MKIKLCEQNCHSKRKKLTGGILCKLPPVCMLQQFGFSLLKSSGSDVLIIA